jgi:drug/metabolite transporter (DMT)-like permease
VSIVGTVATVLFALILIAATRLVLYGFQHSDINIASVILSSQLAFGALIGFLVYRETMSPNEIVSGLLILGAAIVGGMAQKPTIKDIQVHA